MSTISLDLDEETTERLEKLAREQGRDLQTILHEAIIDRLEELEDYPIVMERMSRPEATIPHEEVLGQLGLTDSADVS
jgi:predicted DNA-binding protein